METKRKSTKVVVSVLALAGLLVFSLFAVGGSLEPSGPPGPTMKTLDEVEPRIPISQADIPLTISTPGSYYLTEDVTAAGTAITVAVDDVTIDLSGFALIGPGSGFNHGIYMNGRSNVEIRNGTVRDFYYGIYENTSRGQDHRVINVRAVSNVNCGISIHGKSHLVKDCTASDNGASATSHVYGINAGTGSTVTGNTAYNNGTSATGYVYGIRAGYGSTVTGNTVYNNGHSATSYVIYGILAGTGCTVTGNTAYNNGTSATGSYVYGILANYGSTVTGNTVTKNSGDGIRITSSCTVGDNTCDNNGYEGSDGAGIHATGSDNRIERNNITNNDRGIDVDASGNVIADNMVKANTDNYDIAADNQINILLCEIPETIDWPATVTLAGSLRLGFTDVHGITVEANDVTIDLAGFSLIGPGSGTNYGIYMSGRSNVEIRNGTVRDFGTSGIYEGSTTGKDHRVIDVRSVSNGRHGIYLYGKSNLVKDCTASDNGTSATSHVYGIYAGPGSTVTGNTAYGNGDSAAGNVYGISVQGNTVTGNTVYYNGTRAAGTVYGIRASGGCTVTGNTAYRNGYSAIGSYVYGIYASTGCTVTGNTAYYNGVSATGTVYGIRTYSGCTVTGNTAYNNQDYGIYADNYCLVDQNTAYSNNTNMVTGAGCQVGLNVAP